MEDLIYDMFQERARSTKNDIISFLYAFTRERNGKYLFDSKVFDSQLGIRVDCDKSLLVAGLRLETNVDGGKKLLVITAPYEDEFVDENGKIDESKLDEISIENFDYCCILDILDAVYDAKSIMEK